MPPRQRRLAPAGLMLMALLAALPAPAAAVTYYLASRGRDAGPGTSPQRPWRSLARLESARLAAGDRILLKAGDRFTGQLRVTASGAPGRPLRIGRYGAGPSPVIAGDGRAAAILVRNQQHIEIRDLAITNTVERTPPGQPAERRFGIEIINDGGGVLAHFRLERLTIRDIYAERINDRTEADFNRIVISAIRIATLRPRTGQAGFIHDIVIADNAISRSGRFGVQIGHEGAAGGPQDAHLRNPDTGFNRDIIIRGNRFHELGGSGVQLTGARNVLIENNDFDRTGSSLVPDRMVGRGSGAWIHNCRDIVAQHNRSRHVRGYKDSYGLHVDHGNLNVLYQYNYSEDSEGGFVEILGNNRNVIWRYNISVNDGLREKAGNSIWFSPFAPNMAPSAGLHVYNNTIFVRAGLFPDLDLRARDALIANNIFVAAPHAMIGEQMRLELDDNGLKLAGNLFSGAINREFADRDGQSQRGDPRLVRPGLADPAGYRLRPGSPALAGGVPIPHPPFPAAGHGVFAQLSPVPLVDFFGTPLPPSGNPGIGAAVTVFADGPVAR